jgi:hypothetical protein
MLARQRLDRGVHARLAHQFGRGNTRGATLNARSLATVFAAGPEHYCSAPPTATAAGYRQAGWSPRGTNPRADIATVVYKQS